MSEDNQKQDETTEINSEASQSEGPETAAVSAADDTIADPAQVDEAGVADETFTGDETNDVVDTAASAEPRKALRLAHTHTYPCLHTGDYTTAGTVGCEIELPMACMPSRPYVACLDCFG